MSRVKDRDTLEWLRTRVDTFVRHLATNYPDDPRTLAVQEKLNDVRLLSQSEAEREESGTWKNGKFKHSTGVLYCAPRDTEGRTRTESSLHKTIVHELAHATRFKYPGETSHSQQWKQTWLWFLQIATQELGWKVDIKCAECTFYGLCDRSVCPKCNWMQNLCRPYVGDARP